MKISILTVCLNSENTIERAIKSVLAQDYDEWEHIIVDGGSTDRTVEILNQYDHLKWISEPDKGQSDAMNKAFAMSSGEIISYLNSDDFYSTNAFQEVISCFSKGSSIEIVTGKLKILYKKHVLYREAVDNYQDVSQYWLHRFPANPVAYFYKRNIQEEVGPFPISNYYTMDYWFLLRAFRGKRIIKTSKELGVFDLHSNTKTYNSEVNENLKVEFISYLKLLPFRDKVSFLYPWLLHRFDVFKKQQNLGWFRIRLKNGLQKLRSLIQN